MFTLAASTTSPPPAKKKKKKKSFLLQQQRWLPKRPRRHRPRQLVRAQARRGHPQPRGIRHGPAEPHLEVRNGGQGDLRVAVWAPPRVDLGRK